VVPYVFDQLAMARLPRASYALLVSLLPATACAVGVLVLAQVPSPAEAAGDALWWWPGSPCTAQDPA
jgi:inner membrane transporter RhtA